MRPQFALDQPLKEQVAQLIKGARTDRDKIAAIQEFVLRSTRYVALEFGIYSYKPYPVAQTFARRFGDCKDKASLMIAMLREAGIDAELALVRCCSLPLRDFTLPPPQIQTAKPAVAAPCKVPRGSAARLPGAY